MHADLGRITDDRAPVEAWAEGLALACRRGRSIAERFAELDPNIEVSEEGDRRYRSWREITPFEEGVVLPSAPELYGRSDDDLRRLLSMSAVDTAEERSLDWCDALASIASTSAEVGFERCDRDPKLEPRVLPLLGIAHPFLAWFRSQAAAMRSARLPTLSDLFEPHLELRIFRCIAPALLAELNLQRSAKALAGRTAEERFDAFCQGLVRPAVRVAFYTRYPVIARQVMTLVADNASFATEVAGRLDRDWVQLLDAGLVSQADTAVEDLAFAGDPHAGGRTVLVLTFASGRRLVYKPRPMRVEAHFQRLLAEINREQDLQFRTFKVVNCVDHGWCEYVTPAPLAGIDEARRFYKRQGGLLALLHLLAAVDFHAENVIAAGEHPVLVDLETLFSPPLSRLSIEDENVASRHQFFQAFTTASLGRIGLLPAQRMARDSAPGVDVSGLAGRSGQVLPVRALGIERVGTDEMSVVLQEVLTAFDANRPSLDGTPLSPHEYVDDLREGFCATYQTVLGCRERLLAPAGAVAAFEGARVRVLLRATIQYSTLLSSMAHPRFVRDGEAYDFRLDRFLASRPGWPCAALIADAERRDLWRRDIPVFTTTIGSRDLLDSDGTVVKNFLDTDGLTLVRERFCNANLRAAESAAWYVKGTVECSHANLSPENARTIDRVPIEREAPHVRPRSLPEDLQEMAVVLAERIAHLRLDDGANVLWPAVRDTNDATHLELMQYDLYGGLAGVAFFLAYLGAVTTDSAWTELARNATGSARRILGFSAGAERMGAFGGVAGYIYLLTHLAALWQEQELVDEALGMLNGVEALVERDESFDIISGSAGVVLVMLGLAQATSSKRPYEVARACGEHLLAKAEPQGDGLSWSNADIEGAHLTGFGHGAAGIGYALLQLYATTRDQRFRRGALSAIAFERSKFDRENQEWPDLRDGAEARVHLPGWCHGAAGIGAARSRMLSVLSDPEILADIHIAAASTVKNGFGHTHSLCHGDIGNLDLLSVMSTASKGVAPGLRRSLARRVLNDVEAGGYKTGVAHGVDSLDLMRGIAGMGYGFLRQSLPESLPSVLLLDAPRPKPFGCDSPRS